MPFPFRVIVLSSALMSPVAFMPAEPSHVQNSNPETLTTWPTARPLDPTADSHATDTGVARTIRDVLATTAGLSIHARNVKITARDGAVTLAGPVKSARERAKVVAIAEGSPGVTSVDDDLIVSAE